MKEKIFADKTDKLKKRTAHHLLLIYFLRHFPLLTCHHPCSTFHPSQDQSSSEPFSFAKVRWDIPCGSKVKQSLTQQNMTEPSQITDWGFHHIFLHKTLPIAHQWYRKEKDSTTHPIRDEQKALSYINDTMTSTATKNNAVRITENIILLESRKQNNKKQQKDKDLTI